MNNITDIKLILNSLQKKQLLDDYKFIDKVNEMEELKKEELSDFKTLETKVTNLQNRLIVLFESARLTSNLIIYKDDVVDKEIDFLNEMPRDENRIGDVRHNISICEDIIDATQHQINSISKSFTR